MVLDEVSWVQSGSVEIAVGQTDRMLQNRRRLPGVDDWESVDLL